MPSNAQIWHVVFSTRGRNKKTLPTYETVTGMVERLNFAFLVFVSFFCVFEMSRCVTHRYDRNGKHFVDSVPNVYAGTCKSKIAQQISRYLEKIFFAETIFSEYY